MDRVKKIFHMSFGISYFPFVRGTCDLLGKGGLPPLSLFELN
jgi:hypothetical protein